MDKRFEQVDKRFEAMQKSMDQRFEQVDKRFESVQQDIRGLQIRIVAVDKTVDGKPGFAASSDEFTFLTRV
jgi:hypothetical protein